MVFFQLDLQIPANPEPAVDEGEKTDRVGLLRVTNWKSEIGSDWQSLPPCIGRLDTTFGGR